MLLGTFLPVWKHEGSEEGVTLWEYIGYMMNTDREHIEYDEARQRALYAWQEGRR